jgi:hypothetical protein
VVEHIAKEQEKERAPNPLAKTRVKKNERFLTSHVARSKVAFR